LFGKAIHYTSFHPCSGFSTKAEIKHEAEEVKVVEVMDFLVPLTVCWF